MGNILSLTTLFSLIGIIIVGICYLIKPIQETLIGLYILLCLSFISIMIDIIKIKRVKEDTSNCTLPADSK